MVFRYGSADGGKTVNFDPEIHEKMLKVAKNLNVKPHQICNTGVELALCGDIEVHKVDDGKIQVVLGKRCKRRSGVGTVGTLKYIK